MFMDTPELKGLINGSNQDMGRKVAEGIFSYEEVMQLLIAETPEENTETLYYVEMGDMSSVIIARLRDFYMVAVLDPKINSNYRVAVYL